MKKYRFLVSILQYGVAEVEANSLEEAEDLVDQGKAKIAFHEEEMTDCIPLID